MRNLTTTICLTVALLVNYHSAIAEEFKTINTREDVTISFIKNTPINGIRASVVLFAGGDGDIGIDIKNKTVESDNFLVRSRGLFSKYGFLVITPDVPSDMDSIKNDRGNTDYRTDISFLIKEVVRSKGLAKYNYLKQTIIFKSCWHISFSGLCLIRVLFKS